MIFRIKVITSLGTRFLVILGDREGQGATVGELRGERRGSAMASSPSPSSFNVFDGSGGRLSTASVFFFFQFSAFFAVLCLA